MLPGLSAVAAPVPGRRGGPTAAVCVVFAGAQDLERLAARVVAAAEDLGHRLS